MTKLGVLRNKPALLPIQSCLFPLNWDVFMFAPHFQTKNMFPSKTDQDFHLRCRSFQPVPGWMHLCALAWM